MRSRTRRHLGQLAGLLLASVVARAATYYVDSRAGDDRAEGTSPATDALASTWYRREVLPVHLRRLLLGEGGA